MGRYPAIRLLASISAAHFLGDTVELSISADADADAGTLALARGRIGAQEACAAARVAEQHQIDEWGEVEMGHDLDAADCAVRLSSASTFLQLLDRPWRPVES